MDSLQPHLNTALTTLSSTALHIWEQWIWKPANLWRFPLLLFLYANRKVLPLMWHVRLFSILSSHLLAHPSRRLLISNPESKSTTPSPSSSTALAPPLSIFYPLLTPSHCPPMELDFNIHKSNSTFFSDLDHSRIQLLFTLFKTVLNPALKPGPTKDGKLGGLRAMLGATSCSFRREIKMGESYEIWSRVVAWDGKWIYLGSWFVRRGVQPSSYLLTPGVKIRKSKSKTNTAEKEQETDTFRLPADVTKKSLYASALTKYVFKQGRKSIPPETVLRELGLLPEETDIEGTRQVKEMNERGLKVVEGWARLDGGKEVEGLDGLFTGDSAGGLGRVGEWPW